MQKQWSEGLSEEEGVKLVVQSLLDVVESGVANIEIQVVRLQGSNNLTED